MTGERALNIAGSIASLTALGYLLLHLPRRGKRVSVVAGLNGLPKTGRIPIATAKRALKRLPKKYQKCGITPALLREGMEIEREHAYTTKGAVGATARVTADHLCEQLRYYKKLKKYVE
jgi:hypothetical protein